MNRLRLAVEVPATLVAGTTVTWRLTVANEGDEAVELRFPDARRGDVALVDEAGTEVYRWSHGQVFAQALSEVTVPAGGAVTFELTGALDVGPGVYRLEAEVASHPAPAPVRSEVEISP